MYNVYTLQIFHLDTHDYNKKAYKETVSIVSILKVRKINFKCHGKENNAWYLKCIRELNKILIYKVKLYKVLIATDYFSFL